MFSPLRVVDSVVEAAIVCVILAFKSFSCFPKDYVFHSCYYYKKKTQTGSIWAGVGDMAVLERWSFVGQLSARFAGQLASWPQQHSSWCLKIRRQVRSRVAGLR